MNQEILQNVLFSSRINVISLDPVLYCLVDTQWCVCVIFQYKAESNEAILRHVQHPAMACTRLYS